VSVHRLRHYSTEDPFTRVPNVAVTDPKLDLKARGLLLVMLSKPDGWTFRERNLAEASGVGRDQIRTAMKLLIEAGYVVRRRETETGKPPVIVTEVYDSPKVRFPDSGESRLRETRPVSNEVLSNNKAAESDGQTDQTMTVLTGKQTESSKSAIQQKHTETVNVEETDSSYPARLLQELENANLAPDLDEERLADNYLKLHQAAKQAGKAMDGVTIALTLALLERTFGAMPKQARGMVARLVKANGPTAVMHAAVTTAGSSVGMDPKYGDDPLGPVRYLAGVARGRL
jgi:hypothetical protein